MAESIGDRLRLARDAAGLTQDQLAGRITSTKSRISEWETGVRVPQPDNLAGLVGALGVDGHWLLTGKGEMLRTEKSEAQLRLDAVREAITAPLDTLSGRAVGKGKVR